MKTEDLRILLQILNKEKCHVNKSVKNPLNDSALARNSTKV